MSKAQEEYKDRLFCFIFGSEAHKEWTLSLYNVVNGSSYTDPSAITIATLTQVVYLGMHNDVAFLIKDEVSLYEQQSTFNPNMLLRLMQYTSNIYEKLITLQKRNKYGKTQIPLPVLKLVVFYNGVPDAPDEQILQLSDAFSADRRAESDIEIRVCMININQGRSADVLQACKPMEEYTWTVETIRSHEKEMELSEAIDQTLDEMPDDYIIKPYLEANRVQVKNASYRVQRKGDHAYPMRPKFENDKEIIEALTVYSHKKKEIADLNRRIEKLQNQ